MFLERKRLNRILFLFVTLSVVISMFAADEAEAGKRRRRRRNIRCLSIGCTVFINNQFNLGSNALLRGVSSHHRFGRGYSYDSRLNALIREFAIRQILGKDLYVPGNPYPNLALNTYLRRGGEYGYLNPNDLASPYYPYTPRPLEGPSKATGQPTPPGGRTTPPPPTPDPSLQAHQPGQQNSAGVRPQADVDTAQTPVDPVSSQRRAESETFPSSGINWHYNLIGQIIRAMSNGFSAKGRFNQQLCNRAYSQSDGLAKKNQALRSRGFNVVAEHLPGDFGGGRAEITAVAVSNNLVGAINQCIRSWLGSPAHKEHLETSYGEYCYAVVPQGDVYSCTGVFR